jgi:precorrin-8X/cobalt-precorrin-8 methylmutase
MRDYVRDPREILRRSFEIVRAETNLSALPPDIAPIAERIVHASGMPEIVADLAYSEGAGEAGRQALAAGAPILCDVAMAAAGVMDDRLPAGNPIHVAIDRPGAEELAVSSGQTRSAAGMQLLAAHFDGAIVVIGNAPTALFRLLEFVEVGAAKPALVLGFAVGFVGAAEAKAALAENTSGLPFVTLRGRRGGSAIAAAALNALILGEDQ